MNSQQRLRVKIILAGIVVVAAILILRLYSKQIIQGQAYFNRAQEQYSESDGAKVFNRGSIFFESKTGTRVAVASIERGYAVYINPTEIKEPAQTYDVLTQFIDISRDDFDRAIGRVGDVYEEILHRLDEKNAQALEAIKIKGVGITPESWRFYSGGGLAAHTVGLVGKNQQSNDIEGRYGLEKYYEKILKKKGAETKIGIFAEIFSSESDNSCGDNNADNNNTQSQYCGDEKGGDIVTTIEPTVEGYLEKILHETYAVWKPDEIGGIVIDPQNGEIIAMGLLPTFDPNDTSAVKDPKVFSNSLIEHVYEMGSIVKPLTVAMGFDTNLFTPESVYDDTGTMTLNGKTFGNFDRRARGITTMQELLKSSLNIGAATIALKVGSTTMSDYFSKYGLGEKTGIDLPNEATGLIRNLKSGRDIDTATASFGQGISVSPIEIVRALSILANGGYLINPHLVKEIRYSDGQVKKITPSKFSQVLKTETTTEVTKILIDCVDTALKNGQIKMEKYSVAAKTGTAQIYDRSNGAYYPDKFLHSFFGYFPAYNPRFLVFFYQVNPKGAPYASDTLTDPFNNMTKFLISYYNISPDR